MADDYQPPLNVAGGAAAPTGVCSRWMGDSPCGAAGSHHVIWNYEMTCGCVCPAHTDEIRQNWVYVGLHPYTAACASPGIAIWIETEDRCVIPGAGFVRAYECGTTEPAAPRGAAGGLSQAGGGGSGI